MKWWARTTSINCGKLFKNKQNNQKTLFFFKRTCHDSPLLPCLFSFLLACHVVEPGTPTQRTRRQHAELYLKTLTANNGNVAAAKPKISSGNWSWEENSIFEDALASFGESTDRWRKIAQLLPDRTPSAVQKHYQLLMYDVTRIEAGEIAKREFYPVGATRNGGGSSSGGSGGGGSDRPLKKRKK